MATTIPKLASTIPPVEKKEGARKHQLLSLTSLRFFAANLIVTKHCFECFGITKPIDISNLGFFQGVTCFFVLSGFILTYVHPVINTKREALGFLTARFARIWPGYAASLLFLIAVMPATLMVPHAVFYLLANLSMTQAWTLYRPCYTAFNTPTWSVSVELLFYLCFPLLIRSLKTTWMVKAGLSLLLALSMVAIVTVGFFPNFPALGTSAPILLNVNPLGRMFEFLCGMAVAVAFMAGKHFKEISGNKATLFQVLSLFAVAFCISLPSIWNLPGQFRIFEALRSWIIYSGVAPAYAALILSLSLEKGLLNELLSKRPFVYLGELSYSLFLFHYPAFLLFARFKAIWEHIPIGYVVVAWWFTSLLLSAASFELIEKPFRKGILRKFAPN